jgi:hypothetical protein
MPPKKKRSKSKSRPTQTQSQKVVVNIGGTSTKRKKRSGRGGSSGVRAPNSQNLIPFHIQTATAQQPLVDYDRIARMTGALQERNEPNRTPSLQSQAPSVMAVAAAEQRRAGPTASGFQEPASIASRRESDAPFEQPQRQLFERVGMSTEDMDAPRSATKTRVAPHRGTQPYISSLPNRPVVSRGQFTQQQMLDQIADDMFPDMNPTQAQEVVGQELLDAQKEAQKRDFI